CEIDPVLPLVPHDRADVFRDRVLRQRVALQHALAVRANRVLLVLQIGAHHLHLLLGQLHGLRRRAGHPAEIIADMIDVFRDLQRVAQLKAACFSSSAAMAMHYAPLSTREYTTCTIMAWSSRAGSSLSRSKSTSRVIGAVLGSVTVGVIGVSPWI